MKVKIDQDLYETHNEGLHFGIKEYCELCNSLEEN
jgi:hypothetical protein